MKQPLEIVKELGLSEVNPGASTGAGWWSSASAADRLESVNPATGEVIARVTQATAADYEQVVGDAQRSFAQWRLVPAPKRGEIIRLIGQALREKKDALGSLVSMEVGKIKAEGDGEVQEMIDMADFAVGQSRMLYGQTMHSERGSHRMYEQWHPLGPVGVITAFNFPVAVWAWNAFHRGDRRGFHDLEALAESASLRDCSPADLQSGHGAAGVIGNIFALHH